MTWTPRPISAKMDGLQQAATVASATVRFSMSTLPTYAPYVTISAAVRLGELHVSDQPGSQHSLPINLFLRARRRRARATIVPQHSSQSPSGLGCLAPLNSVFKLISPQTAPEFNLINNPRGTSCFSNDTMATLLDNHNPQLWLEVLHSGLQ